MHSVHAKCMRCCEVLPPSQELKNLSIPTMLKCLLPTAAAVLSNLETRSNEQRRETRRENTKTEWKRNSDFTSVRILREDGVLTRCISPHNVITTLFGHHYIKAFKGNALTRLVGVLRRLNSGSDTDGTYLASLGGSKSQNFYQAKASSCPNSSLSKHANVQHGTSCQSMSKHEIQR